MRRTTHRRFHDGLNARCGLEIVEAEDGMGMEGRRFRRWRYEAWMTRSTELAAWKSAAGGWVVIAGFEIVAEGSVAGVAAGGG